MNCGITSRAAGGLVRRANPKSASVIWRRCESSFRRTTQRLNVTPEPSFTHSRTPGAQDQIIFNPPSSAPSVYLTPSIFLPRNDPRLEHSSAAGVNSTGLKFKRLPPPVRPTYEKRYHLTDTDIVLVRQLRTENPCRWTREILAEKFHCSSLFIGMICEASSDHKEKQKQVLEAVKSRWGRRRRMAREDRTTRRDTWGREE
ncbi:MAG: hypothetical protein M1827_004165 [Pycnora praestabilis]|nr:MAG: hypothetical protein M1827_004165 [Pycnora praestabilis]